MRPELERNGGRRALLAVLASLLVAVAACSGLRGGAVPTDTGTSAGPPNATATGEAAFEIDGEAGEAVSEQRGSAFDDERRRERRGDAWEVRPADEGDSLETAEHEIGAHGGGPRNIVRLVNRVDGRLRIKARIELNRIPGERVAPLNEAFSFASCTECQTLTVALQLNLYERGASFVAPENYAVALNYECTRCHTVARAFQYVIPTDDPKDVPREARALIRELERELRAIRSDRDAGLEEAERRIQAVIDRFVAYSEQLLADRDETTALTSPGATALPAAETPAAVTPEGGTPTPEATPASALGPSPTATASADATASPEATVEPGLTATPSATP